MPSLAPVTTAHQGKEAGAWAGSERGEGDSGDPTGGRLSPRETRQLETGATLKGDTGRVHGFTHSCPPRRASPRTFKALVLVCNVSRSSRSQSLCGKTKGISITFIKNSQDWNTAATASDRHRAGLRPPRSREGAASVLEGSLPRGAAQGAGGVGLAALDPPRLGSTRASGLGGPEGKPYTG